MNDDDFDTTSETAGPDRQLEAALTRSYAAHAGKLGRPTGRIDDVLHRVRRRRSKRRALASVTSVALIGAGIAGMLALGQIDSQDAARRAGAPTPSMPGVGDAWFVCDGAVERDGATVFDSCELETPYADPAWSCSGEVADPAVDGDDRPRFRTCTAVGAASADAVCAPATIGTLPPTFVESPTDHTPTTFVEGPTDQPPTTYVEELCGGPQPTTTMTVPVPVGTAPATDSPQPSFPLPSAAPTTAVGTVPRIEPGEVVAIGDSVMLGAADVLAERGWTVIAEPAAQMADSAPTISELVASGLIGPGTRAVIVHLGTNGPFNQAELDAVLAPLGDVPNVLLYTILADREWAGPNNELLRAASDAHDNVVLIDWAARAGQCVGDCIVGDGIHVGADGKTFYADLAHDWTGM